MFSVVSTVGSGAMEHGPSAGNVENLDEWLSEERPERSQPSAVDPRQDASRSSEVRPRDSSQMGSWNWNDGWYDHSWRTWRPYWSSYYEWTWGSQQGSGNTASSAENGRAPGEGSNGATAPVHGVEAAGREQATSTPAEDPWMTNDPWRAGGMDWWHSDSSWHWGWRSNWDWSSSSWGWEKNQNFKPDYTEPPAWPGWTHRRYWVTAIRRWDRSTDIPMHKRAEKVLRVLGWEMQADFEHIPESTLSSSNYLQEILRIIDSKAGVREDDDKRRAFRAVMVESGRRKDETLAQYSLRRQRFHSRGGLWPQSPSRVPGHDDARRCRTE